MRRQAKTSSWWWSDLITIIDSLQDVHQIPPLTFASPTSPQRSPNLPPGLSLLILDTLASPGNFLIAQFLAKALKVGRGVVLVGLAESLGGWEGLGKKMGANFTLSTSQNRFRFISASEHLSSASHRPTLKDLYRKITDAAASLRSANGGENETPLIVIDDLTSLIWSGWEADEVVRFMGGLQAFLRKTRASLITLFHADLTTSAPVPIGDIEEPDEYLCRSCIRRADVIIRTRSLGSSQVGELTIQRGPNYFDDPNLEVTRGVEYLTQYRLEEGSVNYVNKGLDRGFL